MTKKKRAPDLTEESIHKIIDILDSWQGKLTWELLISEVKKAIGATYSRYTFFEYPSITNAFQIRKEALRHAREGEPRTLSTPKDARLAAAFEQIERYKAKIARLEKENNLLLEQFVTWAHNAELKGVTMDMLNRPFPKPDRDKSRVKNILG